MKIKRFSIIENNEFKEKTFSEKLEEDYDIIEIAKGALTVALEDINSHNIETDDEFNEFINEHLLIDETDLIDFDLDKEIDLCIYAKDYGNDKCPETDWEYLTMEISKHAKNALTIIVENIIRDKFTTQFNEFMTKNNLQYDDISSRESYSYAAPKKVKSIENGEIYEYRKLVGSFNVDEYHYRNEEFKVNIYIKKVLL